MNMRTVCRAASLAVAIIASPASAALVTQTYDFRFTDFTGSRGHTPPAPMVIGSFSITYDPTLDYGEQYVSHVTDGLVLHSLNIALDSILGFNYDASLQRLNLGGVASGVDAITQNLANPTHNDLWFNFRNVASGTPSFQEMNYTLAGTPDFFYSRSGGVNVVTVPVPEPASYALILAGLVITGWMARPVSTVRH